MRVSTPSDYAKLLNNELDVDSDDTVIIDWRAHPNILSQPKYFGDSLYSRVCFEDGPIPFESNRLCMDPAYKYLRAVFLAGSNLTYGLPMDYIANRVFYANKATITDADLEPMLKWTQTSSLDVLDSSGYAAVYLSHHAEHFKDFEKLAFIALIANPKNYKDIKIRAFLENVAPLYQLAIHVTLLSDEQAVELAGQEIPAEWRSEVRRDETGTARVIAWMVKD